MNWGEKKRQAFKCHGRNKAFNVIKGCIGFMRMPHLIILGMPRCPTLASHSLRRRGLDIQEAYKGLIQMYKSDGRAISKHEPYTEAPKSGQSHSPHRLTVPLTAEEEGCVTDLSSERGSPTWKTLAVSLRTSPQSLQVALPRIVRPGFGIWRTWIWTLTLCLPCWWDLGKHGMLSESLSYALLLSNNSSWFE